MNKKDIINSILLFMTSAVIYFATSIFTSIIIFLIFPDHKDVEYRTYIPSSINMLILCVYLASRLGTDKLYFVSGLKSIYTIIIGILAVILYSKVSDKLLHNTLRGHLTLLTGYRYLIIFIMLVVIGPILEEILYRGYLFEYSKHKYGNIAAWIISLSISLIMHYGIGSKNALNIYQMLYISIGMALITVTYIYGNLAASIIIHGFINWYGFLC